MDDELAALEFDEYLRENAGDRQSSWASTADTFERYCASQERQAAMHKSHMDVAHLACAFAALENIQSIHISQAFTERSGPWCGEEGSPDGYRDFLDLPTSQRMLGVIVAALVAADRKIESLTLMSMDDFGPYPLVGLIKALNVSNGKVYRDALSHLRVLTIFLPHDGEDADVDEAQEEQSISIRGLSDLMNSLPMLQEVVFPGDVWHSRRILQSFLDSLRIKRLRSIEIRGAAFATASSLVDFLKRHSEGIVRVRFCDLILHEGSWRNVFHQIRTTLNLQSSEMSGNFYTATPGEFRSVEIGYDVEYHCIPILQPQCIEEFIERRTDVDPFDLLQKYLHEFPLHSTMGEIHQCAAHICPHYYTPEQAARELTNKKQNVGANGLVYNLTRHDLFLLSLILRRQNRREEAGILWKVSAGELDGEALRYISIRQGTIRLMERV
ncbi:hypothetical protein IF2G_10845 [Cordyceps javanica]|nr:hypothetical protein IF2G_10845 [Cordyceps javanica]